MNELLGILVLIIAVWLHQRYVGKGLIANFYWLVLFVKICAGLMLGWVYQHYYEGGDTWNYFVQAKLLSNFAFDSWENFQTIFWQNNYQLIAEFSYLNQPRAALMVKMVAVVNLLTGVNYNITSAYFSFFSFAGLWSFAAWVSKKFDYGKIAAIAVCFWPSVVFWSSGLLKESVALGLILWTISTYYKMIESSKFSKAVLIAIALYVLFLIKYYFASVLLVVLLIDSVMRITSFYERKYYIQVGAWIALLTVGMFSAGFLHYNLEPLRVIEVIRKNNEAFMELSSSNSLVHFYSTSSNYIWVVTNAPKALFAGLFLPLGIPKNGVFYSLAILENWLLLALFIRGVYLLTIKELKQQLFILIPSAVYIGMLAVFLALSTPNLGTLSRYRVAYIPIFISLIFLSNKFMGQLRRIGK
jgi:hypothetical protein